MNTGKIKIIIMDVDGTLTDGKIIMSSEGEFLKAFNVKDGLRIKQLPKFGITPVIITGRKSTILEKRMQELGVLELHQGISNKVPVLENILTKYGLTYENVAYIGDDENDYSCMKLCSLKGCPANAVDPIIEITDFVSTYNGGEGAVREFLDYILKDKLKDHSLDCEY
jgi:3-deoxy-D-manno-octulosonate 8-phosphate phosphatase (KDO 8-P phosphatase)